MPHYPGRKPCLRQLSITKDEEFLYLDHVNNKHLARKKQSLTPSMSLTEGH